MTEDGGLLLGLELGWSRGCFQDKRGTPAEWHLHEGRLSETFLIDHKYLLHDVPKTRAVSEIKAEFRCYCDVRS